MKPIKLWLLSFVLWLSCQGFGFAAELSDEAKVLHVLNRLGFGPVPGQVEQVKAMGVEAYIQQQLSPETIAEPPSLTTAIDGIDTLQLDPHQLLVQYAPGLQIRAGTQVTTEEFKKLNARASGVALQARDARLLRAIESPRQLQEVMVDFWYNHFNVYAFKNLTRIWVGAYERQAIRPHALGKFRDLLGATARHPAMSYYLDNWVNSDPNGAVSDGKFKGLNENYARELMELHTLGVDGGYTQADVTTLARILTGWGYCLPRQTPQRDDGFCFFPRRHDNSDKVWMGHSIKGAGQQEGEQVLDILARSPATAKHISYKLAQYFVADQPPPALVDRLAKRFLETDGEIRSVLSTLFASPEFWDPQFVKAKFKTPYQFVVSAVRATGIEMPQLNLLQGLLFRWGMAIYGCETPDGYKNTQEAWLSPDTMTRRVSWATMLSRGRFVPARSPTGQTVDAAQLKSTLGQQLSATTEQTIASSPPGVRAALVLGSPDFMYR